MKNFTGVLCALAISAGTLSAHAADQGKLNERLENASQVLHEVMATPDKGIPSQILAGASCVVVVPGFKKGAFIVGGEYGQGAATCRTGKGTWSAPVFVKLEGGSFGFQAGGQSTDLVLVAMNQNGLQKLLGDNFKIGGDAAASAGPVGRNAQAGTDWKLNAEFLTYSRSKGLFAGLDLTGTVVKQNKDDMRVEYGSDVPFKTVLSGGTPTPANARPFVHTVSSYFAAAKASH